MDEPPSSLPADATVSREPARATAVAGGPRVPWPGSPSWAGLRGARRQRRMGSRGRGRGCRAHPALLAMPRAFAARLPASRARPPRAPCPARRRSAPCSGRARSAAAPSSRGGWSMKVSPPPARGSAPRRPARARDAWPIPPRAGSASCRPPELVAEGCEMPELHCQIRTQSIDEWSKIDFILITNNYDHEAICASQLITPSPRPSLSPSRAAPPAPAARRPCPGTGAGGGSGAEAYTTDEALSRLGFGRFQALLLGFLGTGWVAEAMEVLLLSFVGPSVKEEWGVSGGAEGLITSVAFAGMLLGACVGGLVSDRYGRRAGFLFTAIVSGVPGFLCAFSPNYATLLALRFVVGLGLGGSHVLPTWFLEFVPAENRGSWIAAFTCFWTLGTILEALLAWELEFLASLNNWRASATPTYDCIFSENRNKVLMTFEEQSPRLSCQYLDEDGYLHFPPRHVSYCFFSLV
ncbi:uncharacterized protein LOC120662883 [Panicum virgatum]|uniref:uncharacterized protein LOC120662883 n=1 Tax=Panicum virgatum TaxID=38727 RepID=UPI0019D59318|nr:uncharacterized protein LOC120662883 [Panicum virgatum]